MCTSTYKIQKMLTILTVYDSIVGGVCTLTVEDMFQVPPVKEYKLFDESSYADPEEMSMILSGLWSENFKLYELHTIMRQRDETSFATILTI